jgi:hypothetical protein
VPDYEPFSRAFHELDVLVFLEVLNTATNYLELFRMADEAAHEEVEDEDDEATECNESEGEGDERGDAATGSGVTIPPRRRVRRPMSERLGDLGLAEGFTLNLKVKGWQLFCARLGVPPFATWQLLPGFHRVEYALRLAQKAAFIPEGMACFLNRLARDRGEDDGRELGAVPFSAEATAAGLEKCFRGRAAWWGGEEPGDSAAGPSGR